MTFASACEATPGLAGESRPGLRALKAGDRGRIHQQATTRISRSVDLDNALETLRPNEPRWDYGVAQGLGSGEHVHWIEVHPASGGASLHEMQAKLNWLKAWLATTPLGVFPRTVVWISSGRSAFNGRSPQIKALVNQGLRFSGGHLRL